jgi:hypothetical protein
MCTDTTHHVCPRPGGKTSTPEEIEIHNFGRGLPAFSFSYIHVVSEKNFFLNSSILTLFDPPERPLGGKKPEIHNLCPPCPKDASYQI